MADSTGPGTDDLQFDRAIDAAAPDALACTKCNSPIRMYYYTVNGETVCSTCKQGVDRALGGGAGKGRAGMLKPVFFGLGAAIGGALIYYAVMEYMNLEIGIVAILIGFMVGYAIRYATGGAGGRRYQVLAAALTYLAVAFAYAPFMLFGDDVDEGTEITADSLEATGVQPISASDSRRAAAELVDADGANSEITDADATESALDDIESDSSAVTVEQLSAGGFAIGLAGALFFIIALPVIVILGSMPSGLISAVIIGFGMRQAWTMTSGEDIAITGPFKVGGTARPATAQG